MWEAFFGVLKEALGIAVPIVEEHIAQQYDAEQKASISEWNYILSIPSENNRADRLNAFVIKLCNDAGTPTGGLSPNISLPLSHLNALVTIATGKIKDDKVIGSLIYLLRKQG